METITFYFLVWIVVVIIVLAFIPRTKIREITGFFKEVLPRLPITDIIKLFRKWNLLLTFFVVQVGFVIGSPPCQLFLLTELIEKLN